MDIFTAVIWFCLVSPINDWTTTKQEGVRCLSPQQQGYEKTFATLNQCEFFLDQVTLQASTRKEQEKMNRVISGGVEDKWKVKSECRVKHADQFLNCIDCES